MSLNSLIRLWRTDPDTAPNFSIWRTTSPRPAQSHPFPDDLPAALRDVLSQRGIDSLYSHQFEAWSHIRAGKNIVLATGTASGKTLAYNLPILASLLTNTDARALYLFPTKALAQDQLSGLHQLQASIQNIQSAIYDGDTPQSQRALMRKNARLILSNPDMLHTGILPHHTNWADFFRNLRFIVIDEMHTYRGVFGSHVANVIRKLKRVAKFYGAAPQFILTSATIGNPKELAERLIESSIELIDHDGSSRGERHFLLYNPPVIDEALGLRKSSMMESVRLTQDLLANDIQSVVFARSRQSMEMMLTYLQTPPDLRSPSPNSAKHSQREQNLGRPGGASRLSFRLSTISTPRDRKRFARWNGQSRRCNECFGTGNRYWRTWCGSARRVSRLHRKRLSAIRAGRTRRSACVIGAGCIRKSARSIPCTSSRLFLRSIARARADQSQPFIDSLKSFALCDV